MHPFELIRKETHPNYFRGYRAGLPLPPILLNPIIYETFLEMREGNSWIDESYKLGAFLYSIQDSGDPRNEKIIEELDKKGLDTTPYGGGGYDAILFPKISGNQQLVKRNLPLNELLDKDEKYYFDQQGSLIAARYGWAFSPDMFVAPLGHTPTPFMNWKQYPFTNN